ncbi:hypothetical protein ACKLTP_19225, partial [Paenarthrobacter ureafaciens]
LRSGAAQNQPLQRWNCHQQQHCTTDDQSVGASQGTGGADGDDVVVINEVRCFAGLEEASSAPRRKSTARTGSSSAANPS